MKPINFEGCNSEIAKDQPEYTILPAVIDIENGTVTTCWELTAEEIETISKTGRVYLQLLTFNRPLQPLSMSVNLDDLKQ